MTKQKNRREKRRSAEEHVSTCSDANDPENAARPQNKTDADQNEQIGDLRDRIARGEKLMIALTFIMMVTGVLQWWSSERQLDDARRTIKLEQRAWIGVMNVEGIPAVGRSLAPKVTIVNSGSTPARNVTTRHEVWFGPNTKEPPLPQNDVTEFPDPDWWRERHTTLHAGAQLVLGNVVMSPDLLGGEIVVDNHWASVFRSQPIYVWGEVAYDDIFDQSHWVKFCYRYEPSMQEYRPCEKYNEFDREQPTK